MDYFDLSKQFNGNLSAAFSNTTSKFFVISFTSDWLYPTAENREIVIALNAIGVDVGFVEMIDQWQIIIVFISSFASFKSK